MKDGGINKKYMICALYIICAITRCQNYIVYTTSEILLANALRRRRENLSMLLQVPAFNIKPNLMEDGQKTLATDRCLVFSPKLTSKREALYD